MHYLILDAARYDLPVLDEPVHRAREMCDEQMIAYVKAILRKSFGKTMVSARLRGRWDVQSLIVLPHPQDFFGSVQRQLETSAPQEISSSSGFNKSALKRAVKDVSTPKELRKAVEAMAKRVEKHFAEDPLDGTGHSAMANTFTGDGISADSRDPGAGIISAVWSACQRQMVDEVGRWQDIMAKVYAAEANAGVGLEWGVDAVQSIMQKAKP